MIKYTEKGHGLHEKLVREGCAIFCNNGVWESLGDETKAQSIIDSYDLDECAKHVVLEIEKIAKQKRDEITKDISPGEMSYWVRKISEAEKYSISQNELNAPTLKLEAATRGIGLPELVLKVLSNAQTFIDIETKIAGACGKHKDAIRQLKTFEEILNYDYTKNW